MKSSETQTRFKAESGKWTDASYWEDMMPSNTETEFIRSYLENFRDMRLLSTGAEVVDISEPLYNVSGSTGDPIPNGASSWKQLLIQEADLAGASCYVTNDTPSGNSHPDFSVGGHVTLESDGSVEFGGICYLMPLCFYHNSTSQNGIAFEHTETKMLKLTGYQLNEPFALFSLRLPSPEPFGLLYFDDADETWKHSNVSSESADNLDVKFFGRRRKAEQCKHRILFERSADSPLLKSIIEANLPGRETD
ncbi:MAG: hypothetical protein AAF664_25265 [Planctomycetota bacterium]